jgi:hypothetical protein
LRDFLGGKMNPNAGGGGDEKRKQERPQDDADAAAAAMPVTATPVWAMDFRRGRGALLC